MEARGVLKAKKNRRRSAINYGKVRINSRQLTVINTPIRRRKGKTEVRGLIVLIRSKRGFFGNRPKWRVYWGREKDRLGFFWTESATFRTNTDGCLQKEMLVLSGSNHQVAAGC